MLDKLFKIERQLPDLLFDLENEKILANKMSSMYIDYHPPVVERIYFQLNGIRVYFHKIHKCSTETNDALYHPHPWESAIRIIKGSYEMGVGHSATDEHPPLDCKLVLPKKSAYEMIHPDGWHYVRPETKFVYSLMITGNRYERKMPLEPDKKFRELTDKEYVDIILVMRKFYCYF